METNLNQNELDEHKPVLVQSEPIIESVDGTPESQPNSEILISQQTIQLDSSSAVIDTDSDNNKSQISDLHEKLSSYEKDIEQFKSMLQQKENTIKLYDREKSILEKEKQSLKKETELAIKEKENVVIRFATKEISLLDFKKQKDLVEKQLNDSKKEIKNLTIKFQTLNEEKSRISYMLEEKCIELKKQQKETDKYKSDVNNLEMKLKWNTVKLNQEIEHKLVAEKKLEEEKCGQKPEEKVTEEKRMENEASMILLKHEVERKDKMLETVRKDLKIAAEKIVRQQEALNKETNEKTILSTDLDNLKLEHTSIQNLYSQEMLNSAKLRGQLEDLNVLQTRNTLNEQQIDNLNIRVEELQEKLKDSYEDNDQFRVKENELLSLNKELTELNVELQNEILLQTSKATAIEAESDIIKKEKVNFDTKYSEIESRLNTEIEQKNEERLLLAKHLSEKTKLYESVKIKLENAIGDLDATKKKNSQVFKELNREIHKYKKLHGESKPCKTMDLVSCKESQGSRDDLVAGKSCASRSQHSDSESDVQSNSSMNSHTTIPEPSTQHLINRILRLQQGSARQTEKIDFLENHTMSLVSELQKKSKLIQYYMVRDQAGALTSSKSDVNKSELAKYGGVMSAIYSGIKGTNQTCMTLDLSLEINKKLQAVLEDTLLKNITLKENLDVLGLEVDKLTRQLSHKSRK